MPQIPPNRITAFPLKDDLQWYDPDIIFKPFDDIFGRGVVGSTDLQVVANGPADGQITVKAGRGYVPYTGGGKRLFQTSVDIKSSEAEFIHSIGAAAANPRIDRIVAKILDATINPSDVYKGGFFDVIAGTPTAGATLANLSGAAAVPSNATLLGNVLVNGATIPTGNIDSAWGGVRAKALIGAGNSPIASGFQVDGVIPTPVRTYWDFVTMGNGIVYSYLDDSANDRTLFGVDFDATTLGKLGNLVPFYTHTSPSGGETEIDVNSIPSTYSCIIGVLKGRIDVTGQNAQVFFRFNSSGSAIYNDTGSSITGATISADENLTAQTGLTAGTIAGNGASTGRNGILIFFIPHYAETTFYKYLMSLSARSTPTGSAGTGNLYTSVAMGEWESTSAISSIQIFARSSGNKFMQGTKLSVYLI